MKTEQTKAGIVYKDDKPIACLIVIDRVPTFFSLERMGFDEVIDLLNGTDSNGVIKNPQPE